MSFAHRVAQRLLEGEAGVRLLEPGFPFFRGTPKLTGRGPSKKDLLWRSKLFRGLRPEAGNAGSRGDLSHIILEVLATLLQLRSAHVCPLKRSPKA